MLLKKYIIIGRRLFAVQYTNMKSLFFIYKNYSECEWVSSFFDKIGFKNPSFYSKMTKNRRQSIQQTTWNQWKVLIATTRPQTDLDIHVDLPINYGAHATPEGYVMRLKIIVGEGRSETWGTLVNTRKIKLLDPI